MRLRRTFMLCTSTSSATTNLAMKAPMWWIVCFNGENEAFTTSAMDVGKPPSFSLLAGKSGMRLFLHHWPT